MDYQTIAACMSKFWGRVPDATAASQRWVHVRRLQDVHLSMFYDGEDQGRNTVPVIPSWTMYRRRLQMQM
jgi:hypothetical protein